MSEHRKPRCPSCLLHLELCICSLIPILPTKTRLVLLLHAQEEKKPSNTGRLALRCLPNSEMRLRGLKEAGPLSLEGLVDDEYETRILCLHPEAEVLTEEWVNSRTKPIRLLVPDGTWSQASRLASKLRKQLPQAGALSLRAGKPSRYLLRTEHHPDGMATFEAIARVMGFLESQQVENEMEKIFRILVDRMLWTRGKLAANEVSGGLPSHKGRLE